MRGTIGMALLMAAAGCGDDAENLFDEPTPVPAGPHHTFVVSALHQPINAAEAQMFGLDIDHKLNDGVDNILGNVMGSVALLFPEVPYQAALEQGLAIGDPIFL